MKIIFISQDNKYTENVANYYVSLGFKVRFFDDIDILIESIKGQKLQQPTVMVLDIDDAGDIIGLISKIRSVSFAPCIVRTKFEDDMACLTALDAGADDYVASSAPLSVLHARIRAILRRVQPTGAPEPAGRRFFGDGWYLSTEHRELFRPDGSPCLLTSAEFAALETLVHSRGVPVSRNDLLLRVFGRQFEPGDRAIDSIVFKLRKKMDQSDAMINSIKSVRNVGYVFAAPGRDPLRFNRTSSRDYVAESGWRCLQHNSDVAVIRSPTEGAVETSARGATSGGGRFGSPQRGVGRAELKYRPTGPANSPGAPLPASADTSRRELERLAALIDWAPLERLLAPLRTSSERLGYPPLALFRALLVAQRYRLSDAALAEALADRLSFRRFCGFGPDDGTPDEAALHRFRAALAEGGLAERLFAELDDQLDALRAGTPADAISIATPARSDQRLRRG